MCLALPPGTSRHFDGEVFGGEGEPCINPLGDGANPSSSIVDCDPFPGLGAND
jgi:hypothetical protein